MYVCMYPALRIVAYASCSKIGETTVIMLVVEKLKCDPKCHPRSGCSRRGEGKCDFFCVAPYGIDRDTYTCMGECDIIVIIIIIIIFFSPPAQSL